MKQIFSTAYNAKIADLWLLLLRLCVGGFMLTHGIPKLQKLMAGDLQFFDPFGLGTGVALGLAVFAEFLCSILLALGLLTRFASFSLAITMAVAAFLRHGEDPFARKEMALLYLLIYLTILVFGGGRYSLDARIGGHSGSKKPAKGKR